MINLNIDGVKDTIEVFREILLPNYRKQAERKAVLDNLTLQAQIQHLNAQALAEKAKADREKAATELDHAQTELLISQAKKTEAEAQLLLAQAEKTLAEAEKERETLKLERIKLATQIVEKYASNLTGPEKVNQIMRLLPDINRLLESKVMESVKLLR